jgi:hypothetical protein
VTAVSYDVAAARARFSSLRSGFRATIAYLESLNGEPAAAFASARHVYPTK